MINKAAPNTIIISWGNWPSCNCYRYGLFSYKPWSEPTMALSIDTNMRQSGSTSLTQWPLEDLNEVLVM